MSGEGRTLTSASSRPSVSVRMWRLRPFTFLPASPGVGPLACPRTGSPRNPAAFGGFDALAVDHAGGWVGLSPLQLSGGHRQQSVDRLEQSQIAPSVEVALHRTHRWKILRQRTPLSTARPEIEDRIHHLAQVGAAWAPARLCRRQQWGDQRPFLIQHIAWIATRCSIMLKASDISPRHPILHLLDKDGESQPADITQPLFGRDLRKS